MRSVSRRQVLSGVASLAAMSASSIRALAATSTFKIGVISDEISSDFDHACSVIKNDLGLGFVELRTVWGKKMMDASPSQIADAKKILAKYSLSVTDIGSPLFTTWFPGAPVSPHVAKANLHVPAEITFKEQDEILRKSVDLAKQFGTDKVRCFDFWRIEDQKPFRKAINDKLQESAEFCGKRGVMLILENEFACNTATGREAGETLAGVPSKYLALNWDPANAVMGGELDAFPAGFSAITKNRIHHCHVKNAQKDATGKVEWAPVDVGYIDWTTQFKALKAMGYCDAVSLETHWHGGGTPEACTRRSWRGMQKCLTDANCM
jgi:sugar phosphate isomerase/epimerase